MNKIFNEFKEFAVKGNAADMAVGIIIGAAFGKIVNSIVKDLLNPIFSLIIKGKDFSNLQIIIQKTIIDIDGNIVKPELAIKYGAFINNVFDFLIITLSIFFVIKAINRLRNLFTLEQHKLLLEQNKLLSEQNKLLMKRMINKEE